MQRYFQNFQLYAPVLLRYAMSAVILWFGVQQFIDTQTWTAYVPDAAVSLTHMSATRLVYFNAGFELFFGLLLIFGLFTRISALLLALHLFDIMWVVGYGEIGVRDFGLAVATLVVSMNGPDIFCTQHKKDIAHVLNQSDKASMLRPQKYV